ncbi:MULTISPECIES: hypothetical protein [Methylobacterium]|uniref:hypothetical protein n=1 Tax=Methylobacterium TaxID=407 RepID=UPI001046C3B8|nr:MULTISPECIES: hypothetical protein [Methylobacterium]MDR7035833.1 hypothetical protein [Methylobacterium sp. BE186]
MSDAHQQLVEALRTIISEGADPWTLVDHIIEDVEREKPAPSGLSREEVPGPYAPNAWSMYTGSSH